MHALEDPGDTELPALAGGEVLKTIKIVGKELRAGSKVARAGMDRIADALTTVSLLSLHTLPCTTIQYCLCIRRTWVSAFKLISHDNF